MRRAWAMVALGLLLSACVSSSTRRVVREVRQTVPNVVGKTVLEGRIALEMAGYTVDAGDAGCPGGAGDPSRQIEDQRPPSGTPLAKGSRVTLVLSGGPGAGC